MDYASAARYRIARWAVAVTVVAVDVGRTSAAPQVDATNDVGGKNRSSAMGKPPLYDGPVARCSHATQPAFKDELGRIAIRDRVAV